MGTITVQMTFMKLLGNQPNYRNEYYKYKFAAEMRDSFGMDAE